MKRYLTADDAAEYLGLTRDALYSRTRAGQIPASKLGRKLRWDVQDLDLMMRRNRIDTRAAS